ncbi:hypothetical protein DFH06DRAFT_191077 [Mycena polygramma]|nr:hypothetical protein DFH06DRAFT_191077 [Mycena polygramma]
MSESFFRLLRVLDGLKSLCCIGWWEMRCTAILLVLLRHLDGSPAASRPYRPLCHYSASASSDLKSCSLHSARPHSNRHVKSHRPHPPILRLLPLPYAPGRPFDDTTGISPTRRRTESVCVCGLEYKPRLCSWTHHCTPAHRLVRTAPLYL